MRDFAGARNGAGDRSVLLFKPRQCPLVGRENASTGLYASWIGTDEKFYQTRGREKEKAANFIKIDTQYVQKGVQRLINYHQLARDFVSTRFYNFD